MEPDINIDPSSSCPSDTVQDSLPPKSLVVYQKAWNEFISVMKISEETQPTQEDYLGFLKYLREERGYRGKSMSSILSRLNGLHSKKFGTQIFFVLNISSSF